MMLILLIVFIILMYFQDADFILFIYNFINKKYAQTEKTFNNKVVWIVGSSTGIGKHLAIYLAKHKCKLILTATNVDQLNEVKQLCIKAGSLSSDDILVLPFDIIDENEQLRAWKTIVDKFGNIDFLFNNAARMFISRVIETESNLNRKLFEINTLANVNISKLVINHWLKYKTKGQIIVTSSLAAYVSFPLFSTYCFTKKALNTFYECLQMELKDKDIGITIVCPGPVQSELYDKGLMDDSKKLAGVNKVKFMMLAERCAHLMAVGAAYRLREIWITNNPSLYLCYIINYFPFLGQFLIRSVMFSCVINFIEKLILKMD